MRANHPRRTKFYNLSWQYCGGRRAKSGEIGAKVNVVPAICRRDGRNQALAAMRVGSSMSAARQFIATKPGAASTRFSQSRIAGKVERSKSQRSARWV